MLMQQLLKFTGLSAFDRLLGVIFGFLRGVVVVVVWWFLRRGSFAGGCDGVEAALQLAETLLQAVDRIAQGVHLWDFRHD